MTITNAISNAAAKLTAAGITNAGLDAEVFLAHILDKDRAWLFTHGNEPLDNGKRALFENAVQRRATREPLQYIIGKQEFWGLEFQVTPDVLIPRPETELVIESALKIVSKIGRTVTIIDLCTGSGCIAISLAKEIAQSHIFAVDKSRKALMVAKENARKHGVSEAWFLEGDLFQPLESLDIHGQVDLIVSNPPYIRSGDLRTLQPEVRDYEPEIALIAGPEGTELHRNIIAVAPKYLKQRGALIMEMGMGQAAALARIIQESGAYGTPEVLKDLAGIERVIIAHRR